MSVTAPCPALPRRPEPLIRQGWLQTALQAFAHLRQRRSLALLDDHMLADIGISREEALAEAARPVWDVPPAWRS